MARVTTVIAGIGIAASLVVTGPANLVEAGPTEPVIARSTSSVAGDHEPAEDSPSTIVSPDRVSRLSRPDRVIAGGSAEERAVVQGALEGMANAGLELPQIEITIHDSKDSCGGHNGVHRSDGTLSRIDLCHVSEYVITHELSHAWEYSHATDDARSRYMDLAGLDSWNDPEVKWVERGIEQAANTIAKVVMSNGEACAELASQYEALVGAPCGGLGD